jgi:hypothetical protein
MKQPKNPLLRKMFAVFNNVTRNVVHYSSDMIPIDHKGRVFSDSLKSSLGIDSQINNMYEYQLSLGSDYSRLKMLTIVSACSDVEFLLREFIENSYENGINKPKNFYQRLDDVNKQFFVPKGVNLDSEEFFPKIKLGFQIRHICIHNMGYVDENFNKNTGLNLIVGSKFNMDNVTMEDFLTAIEKLIFFLDRL